MDKNVYQFWTNDGLVIQEKAKTKQKAIELFKNKYPDKEIEHKAKVNFF